MIENHGFFISNNGFRQAPAAASRAPPVDQAWEVLKEEAWEVLKEEAWEVLKEEGNVFVKAEEYDKAASVSFQWENPDFLFKNPDSLSKNPGFLLKNG